MNWFQKLLEYYERNTKLLVRTKEKGQKIVKLRDLIVITQILAATEWQPKFDLDSGLEETIKWLKDNSSEKMGEYNV